MGGIGAINRFEYLAYDKIPIWRYSVAIKIDLLITSYKIDIL